MLVDMLEAMPKAENMNYTLKLPIIIRWASMVTNLESVKKNEVVLRKIAVSDEPEKKQRLVRCPGHSPDDTFWHESKAIASLLKPLQSAITQPEEDSPN